jgi:hypothetical protein
MSGLRKAWKVRFPHPIQLAQRNRANRRPRLAIIKLDLGRHLPIRSNRLIARTRNNGALKRGQLSEALCSYMLVKSGRQRGSMAFCMTLRKHWMV